MSLPLQKEFMHNDLSLYESRIQPQLIQQCIVYTYCSLKMHEKEIRIKKYLREEQINQIKSTIRANIVQSYEQQAKAKHTNQQVISAANNHNLQTLQQLLTQKNSNLISILDQTAVITCYRYLNNNLEDTRCMLLLHILIQNYFITIFSNEALQAENELFLKSTYQKIDFQVRSMRKGETDYNGALSNGVNQCLKIIKQFYHTSHNRYSNSINKNSYIKEFILAWLPYLPKNKHYLFILTKIINYRQHSLEYRQQFNIIQKEETVFAAYMKNIYECNDQRWHYSFIVLRYMLHICELEEEFVICIVNDYWQFVINKLLLEYNQKCNTLTRNALFQAFQSLDRLLYVLSTHNARMEGKCFLLQAPFYKLLFQLLATSNDKKYILYPIILKSIQILEFNRQTLLDFIKIQQLDPLVEQLGNHIDHRLLYFVLKIIYKLLRSSHMPCDTYQDLINYFSQQGIVYTLQLLQFHKNTEISMLSIDLLQHEFKQQTFDYQICISRAEGVEFDHMG